MVSVEFFDGANGLGNIMPTFAKSILKDEEPPATAFDGAPVARVRVSLAQPLVHRVRSDRNVYYWYYATMAMNNSR